MSAQPASRLFPQLADVPSWQARRWQGLSSLGIIWWCMLVVMAVLLTALGFLLASTQSDSRRVLEQRFANHGELAAQFVGTYLAETASHERRLAVLRLSGTAPRPSTLARVAADSDLRSAALLDGGGRVLQVWPRRPRLLGQPIAGRYGYLRDALVSGRLGVSDFAPPPVGGAPVVVVAVRFETAEGHRVFAAAFDPRHTSLHAFLDNYSALAGARAIVTGSHGQPISASVPVSEITSSKSRLKMLRTAARLGDGSHHIGDEFVVVEHVAGTPLRVVLTAPTATLYAPVEGGGAVLGWTLLAGFAIAAIAVLVLVRRLNRKNRALAALGTTREVLLAQRGVQLARLQDLDRMKDEFVALASHELRTPLTSIGGYVEMLLEDEEQFEPVQRSFLHTIRRNSDRLHRLVNDLLDLSRIENSVLSLDMLPLALAPVVRDAISDHMGEATQRGLRIVSSIDEGRLVVGDVDRLRQVVDNLLSNAIKYTPAGGTVTVTLADTRDGVLLTVRDTGVGIPEAERTELFERFFRASTARAVQGTGLGLAITRAILTAHGASIAVEDAQPGSAFVVTFPSPGR